MDRKREVNFVNKKGLRDAIDTYEELLRMHQLNLELLETLEFSLLWVQDFSKKYNVAIPNRETLTRLLTKTSLLIEEISATNPTETRQHKSIRRFFTERKSDKDFTEPRCEKVFSSVLLHKSQNVVHV